MSSSTNNSSKVECGVLGCETSNYIQCLNCNFISCVKCTQTFIISQTSAKCMSCNRELSEDYLREKFSKSWMSKDYADWKKNKLLEREKGLLPETVEYLSDEKKKKQILNLIREKRLDENKYKLEFDSLIYEYKYIKNEIKNYIKNNKNSKKGKKNNTQSDDKENPILIEYEKKLNSVLNELKKTELQYLQNQSQASLLSSSLTDYSRVEGENPNCFKTHTIEELISKANAKIKLRKDYTVFQGKPSFYEYMYWNNTNNDNNKELKEDKKERRAFIKPCPAKDCRGFLSNKWICGLCDTVVCKDCHEIKGVKSKNDINEDVDSSDDEDDSNESKKVIKKKDPFNHKCDPNNVETAKALNKETRGCPKCGVRIYKIDGCDQIWCTSCQTAFSWHTGKIETGPVHNPHYFQYLRQQGLNIPRANHPDANPEARFEMLCGQVPTADRILTYFNANNNIKIANTDINSCLRNYLYEIQRFRTHIDEILNPRYRWQRNTLKTQYNPEDYRDLRIRYLNKEIDEKHWNTVTMKRYKKLEYNKMISNLNQTLVAVFGDFLTNCFSIKNVIIKDYHFFDQIFYFIDYYNTESQKYTKLFGYNANDYTISTRPDYKLFITKDNSKEESKEDSKVELEKNKLFVTFRYPTFTQITSYIKEVKKVKKRGENNDSDSD
jgi:hypothetical protein